MKMTKLTTLISILNTTILCFGIVVLTNITVKAETKIIFNGTQINFSTAPINDNGRIYVPMRELFESIGYVVDWDASTNSVTASSESTKIIHTIGTDSLTVGGKRKTFDYSSKLINGKSLMPIRMVVEAIGGAIEWDNTVQTIRITSLGMTSSANNITLSLDGRQVTFKNPPIIYNDNVYIDMHEIFSAADFEVAWLDPSPDIGIIASKYNDNIRVFHNAGTNTLYSSTFGERTYSLPSVAVNNSGEYLSGFITQPDVAVVYMPINMVTDALNLSTKLEDRSNSIVMTSKVCDLTGKKQIEVLDAYTRNGKSFIVFNVITNQLPSFSKEYVENLKQGDYVKIFDYYYMFSIGNDGRYILSDVNHDIVLEDYKNDGRYYLWTDNGLWLPELKGLVAEVSKDAIFKKVSFGSKTLGAYGIGIENENFTDFYQRVKNSSHLKGEPGDAEFKNGILILFIEQYRA